MKRRYWLIFLGVLMMPVVFYVSLVYFFGGTTGEREVVILESKTVKPGKEITVLTINLAHGRADRENQFFVSEEEIRSNLKKIADLVVKEGADLVGLQEADDPSWWSGGFSHIKTLAEASGMPRFTSALSVDGLGLHYGTAVLSHFEIESSRSVIFDPTFPTPRKGFVISSLKWDELDYDFYSAHLDYASMEAKKEQLTQISQEIRERNRPVILVGDFNADSKSGLLQSFLDRSKLKAHQLEKKGMITFPKLQTRIDWIFLSEDFEIVSHEILEEVISDHLPVKMVIRRSKGE